MPARHNGQQPSVLGKTIEEVMAEPVPRLITLEFGICLGMAFDRIIDHAEIETETVDRPIDRGVAEGTAATDELNQVVIGGPAGSADLQFRKDFPEYITRENARQIPIRSRAKLVRIGRVDYFEVGIFAGIPGDEIQNRG